MVMFIILSLIILVAALNIISGMMMLVKDKGARHRGAAHDGRHQGRDDARVPHHRRLDRRRRHHRRLRHRRAVLLAHQRHQGFRAVGHRHDHHGPDGLLPDAAAGADRSEGDRGIVLMAFVLTLMATIYPSWRASKLDPVEVLRYE